MWLSNAIRCLIIDPIWIKEGDIQIWHDCQRGRESTILLQTVKFIFSVGDILCHDYVTAATQF